MTILHVVFLVGLGAAVMGIAIAMLNDVCEELDKRHRNDEIAAATRLQLLQRRA
jgi:hypothetical protein